MVDRSGGKLKTRGNTVSRWELGNFSPNLQDMEILCRVLRIRKEWLMTGKGEIHAGLTVDQFDLPY